MPASQYLLAWFFSSTAVWNGLQPCLRIMFNIFWLIPIIIIIKTINFNYFQKIADAAFEFCRGEPKQLDWKISKIIADNVYSVLIQIAFQGQAILIYYYVSSYVSFFYMALLCSLYSFEYKWLMMGWDVTERLNHIENNWPYFFGFGIPLVAVVQLFTSVLDQVVVFSILFPFFILSATEAIPLVLEPKL